MIAEPVPSTDTDSHRGTWGGVMGSIKTHIATSPTLGNRVDARGQVISSHVDLAAFTVQLRTTNVIIMAAYCRGGDYTRALRQAAEITRNGASPFMILADWNVVPAALEEDELLNMMDAEAIRPAAITCHQGAGRTIDYVVISRKLAPHLQSIEVITEVPWSPHDGLKVRLNADPLSFMTSSFRRPRQLPMAPNLTKALKPFFLKAFERAPLSPRA